MGSRNRKIGSFRTALGHSKVEGSLGYVRAHLNEEKRKEKAKYNITLDSPRLEDQDFKVILDNVVSSRTIWDT